MSEPKNKCVICNERTDEIFNINLEPKYICNSCAQTITMQHIAYLLEKSKDIVYKADEKA